jgi:hypothetical protein
MATQREIIYTIKNILRGGLITDDDNISDRQVAFLIDSARAMLLRQQYNKGQNLSDNNIQSIPCMATEVVDTSLMPDFPSGCSVYKSVLTVPKPIESKGKDLITGISGPMIGALSFDYIPYNRVPFARSTRFKRPFVTLHNGFIYIFDAPFSPNITVSGVYEQPNSLSGYNNCEGVSCYSWDEPYPMSSHLIDPVVRIVIEELMISLRTLQDKTNSGASEFESQLNTNIGGQYGAAQSKTGKKGQE